MEKQQYATLGTLSLANERIILQCIQESAHYTPLTISMCGHMQLRWTAAENCIYPLYYHCTTQPNQVKTTTMIISGWFSRALIHGPLAVVNIYPAAG
jgi:hypothetical protein